MLRLGEAVAGLVFTSNANKQWMKERFRTVLHDILRDSWVYQELRQQAIQGGKAEELLRFVELRFLTLLIPIKEALAHETTPERVQVTRDKLYLSNTLEEATAALQELEIDHTLGM